jgi:phytoene dehydrogenase-like protein
MERWDAICVGAGITSLAFGALLALRHPTARILLIDKHSSPGGYATAFRRPKAGAIFDCSLHKLSGINEGGNLNRIFKDLSLGDEINLKHSDDYFEACLPGGSIKLGNNVDAVRLALMDRYPEEASALLKFFEEVSVHGRNGYYQFQMLDGTYEPDFTQLRYAHKHLKNISVKEAFEERFSNGFLKEILGATGIYVGGFPEDLGYLYFLHVIYATLVKGNAYVEGTSQHLSNILAKKIVSAGGRVMLGTTVKKIITNNSGNVVSVETSRGDFFTNKVYINTSPHYALNTFFDKTPEIGAVIKKLHKLKPSRSTTTLYLITDVDPVNLGLTSAETMVFAKPAEECFTSRVNIQSNECDEAAYEKSFWCESVMEVTNYHALDPANGRNIYVNVLDSITHWPERKAMGYKEKKMRVGKVLLARLIAAKPQLEGHIIFTEVSSPQTYRRFTNNTDGAGYGAMVSKDLTGHLFHHSFPINGVIFLSAWVAGPSYEAAFGFAELMVKQWDA